MIMYTNKLQNSKLPTPKNCDINIVWSSPAEQLTEKVKTDVVLLQHSFLVKANNQRVTNRVLPIFIFREI